MDKRKQTFGMIASAISAIVFGMSFMAVKTTVNEVSAFSLLSWRFVVAFLVMSLCAALKIIKIDFKNKNILPVVLMALFQPVFYFLGETYGIQMTTASESGTIMACIPLVTLALSTRILKEPPTKLQIISIIVSVAGVLMIVLMKGLAASFSPIGYLLLVGAMLSDCMYVMCARKAKEFTSIEKTYVMAALGALVFTACALIEHGTAGTLREFVLLPFTNTNFLWGLIYLAIGSQVIAFMLNNYAIEALGANRAASFAGVSTVVSVIAGVVLLGEDFSLIQGVGTALVILGVYGANMIPKNAKPLKSFDEVEKLKEGGENTTSSEVK